MGIGLSCFRQASSRRLADDEHLHGMKHDDVRISGSSLTMSGCLGNKETKKRQPQQKQKQQQQQLTKKAKKELTLGDWLIDSSLTTTKGLQSQKNIGSSSGEYHVNGFKHCSKRVFPSFVGSENNTNNNNNINANNIKRPKNKERLLLKVEENGFEREVKEEVSLRPKKKVSFKLPEEADIFIFHSSSGEEEQYSGQKKII